SVSVPRPRLERPPVLGAWAWAQFCWRLCPRCRLLAPASEERGADMGTRGPPALLDTTPAKTIVVYRNGDPFYPGRRFVLPRRRATTFEALLEQLTEQVDVPFGVRRLFTPTRGRPVLTLDALQAGGKYVAAGRERFRELE
ncbi:Doublecortin domain-containing protein 2C, partial [Saguinus oedipus]